ncbi:L,D-transpeptidase family protein [Bdellovibrio reynosensis]|uniref:L,D-transpeptidase family protein n=1 Tax=Bdellovibrio reynosensis TaxID=2835041 RepID=A0ABY4CBA1_9BACT|nr:L,D-transpeptidase family protein [Bdellovibrio reynosensis]UOF02190.1 L,D-transpeptidase family protein [Bdellovibrio reynosensis]
MLKLLVIIFALLSVKISFAVGRTEHYEYLTPTEKLLLENGINESTLESRCPRTAEFAKKARWDAPLKEKADFILVDKKRRLIHIINQETVLASFRMALGTNPVGDKIAEGDARTPEGVYFIDLKNRKSEFHLSLGINYPNSKDIEEAKQKGINFPGKDIMIHGLPNGWLKRKVIKHPRDWTKGCMAVRDYEIEYIFTAVDLGTLIEICP